jgi:hypothetical protein
MPIFLWIIGNGINMLQKEMISQMLNNIIDELNS